MTTQISVKPNVLDKVQQPKPKAHAWLKVCKQNDLVINSGVCVLVENKQIAIFSVNDANKPEAICLYASDNYDPIGKANVISRGILCSIGEEMAICSPLYKQHFSLIDGRCFEQNDVTLNIYAAKIEGEDVSLFVPLL